MCRIITHTHTLSQPVGWLVNAKRRQSTVEHNKQMKLIMDTNISIICQAAQEDKTKVENEGHRIKSQIESNQIESKLNSFTHALLLYKASKSVFTIYTFIRIPIRCRIMAFLAAGNS